METFVENEQFAEVVEMLADLDFEGNSRASFMFGGVSYVARFITAEDRFTSIDDFEDWYGRVKWARWGDRPDGFDGAARKIWTRSDCYWWQPPADIVNNNLRLAEMMGTVRNILEYGFQVARVEIDRRCDCCGSYTMIGSETFGGYEPFWFTDSGSAGDMAAELLELAWEQTDVAEVTA